MTLKFPMMIASLFSVLLMFPAQAAPVCPAGGVKVGWEPWLPYAYEEQGTFTGLDLDMATAILTRMGCPFTFVNRPWKRLLTEVAAGDLHLTGGASRTAEREEFGYFSTPYRTESAVMIVRNEDAAGYASITSLKDLIGKNFTLGITRGYYYGEDYAALENDAGFKARLADAGDDVTNYKKLAAKRLDGFLVDPFSAAAGLKKEGFSGRFKTLMTVYSDDIYFLISKAATSPEFVAAFDQALAELKTSGEYQAILDKYLN